MQRPIIVTAYYKEERAMLERCIGSVQNQTCPADHLLIADGYPQAWIDEVSWARPVRHIKLDRSHGDYGNTPRGVGATLAISEGYDGIGFLDADNWLEPSHVADCTETAALHPDADYLVARWILRRPDESALPLPDDLFPDHVDTSCFVLLPGSFHELNHFSIMPQEFSIVGDKVFYLALKGAGLVAAKVPDTYGQLSCLWPSLYRMAGEEPPPEAKPDIDAFHLDGWLRQQTPRALEIIYRRCGVQFVVQS
jgi:hypothetical protein